MIAGCGRFRWNVAVRSASAVTPSTFSYQALRGLARNFSGDLPSSRSHVHLTSLAVNGWPSCHLTPWRSLKVSASLSSLHDQLVARSGTMVSRLFCALCWSYITRLLNTPIIGVLVEKVASSWIERPPGV